MSKRVLLTGIGGFIGAHCLRYWLEKTDWEIIGIDSFRHKGTISRIDEVIDQYEREVGGGVKNRLRILNHDLTVPFDSVILNRILARRIDDRGVIREKPLNYIINMASDSAVERSTTDPVHCMRNNYELAVNMLELARKLSPELFVQVSTDEVYGEASKEPNDPGHREWARILPSNPYAASKAAQEALAIAYWRTYDVPVVITNCMNIVGEMQDVEKFLPRIVRCVALGEEIPIYGDLDQSGYWDGERFWKIGSRVYLDARNKADALMFLTQRRPARYREGAECPDRYHICGDTELTNLELAQMVADIMKKPLKFKIIASESARPGYDRRYALCGDKLRSLGWTPPIPFEQTIRRVVRWTVAENHWVL